MRYSSKPVMKPGSGCGSGGNLGSPYASISSNLSIIEEEPPVLPPRFHHIRKQQQRSIAGNNNNNCDADTTTGLSHFTAKACVSLFGVDGLFSCQDSICFSISDALTPKVDEDENVPSNIATTPVDSEDADDDSTTMDLNQLVYGTTKTI